MSTSEQRVASGAARYIGRPSTDFVIQTSATALGDTAKATALDATAVGAFAKASATSATAIGFSSSALAVSTVALGDRNVVAAGAGPGSIAAGSQSTVLSGKGAVASLVKDTTVTLAFGADGRASGSAGCNNYTAAYDYGAPQLTFKAAATTRKMCSAEGVMEQEKAFLEALESAAIARLEGNRLDLRRADGALAASFVREQAK